MNPQRKTVVIVEDDLLLQQHLIEIIKVAEDITCLGAVSSAQEAEQKILSLQPDVVLLDINLPGKSGIDCIRGLKKRLPNLEVVMLTAYEEEDNIFRALKEGASGYLIKSSNSNDILEAIRDVFAGESPFSGPIARKMAMYFGKSGKPRTNGKRFPRGKPRSSNYWPPDISTRRWRINSVSQCPPSGLM